MPKRSTAKRAAEPEVAETPEVADVPEEPEATAGSEAAGAEGAEEEPVFLNRAARRAKGKGESQPLPHGQQSQFARRGNVSNRRDYGHRRSG
jgi:hypothetical protein